jgi:hypothetical protein
MSVLFCPWTMPASRTCRRSMLSEREQASTIVAARSARWSD